MTRHERFRLILGVSVATIGTAVVLAANAFAATTVVSVYVIVLGALVLAPLTRLAQLDDELSESIFERALRASKDPPLRPPELVRIERELMVGLETAGGLHTRLVPLLRDAAAARLGAKRRIDLVRQPDAARAALGDDVWELVRPDRPAPPARTGPGIEAKRLRALLDTLENI